PLRLFVTGEIHFKGDEHSQDLFLADFHRPPNGVANGWPILLRVIDKYLAHEKQPGALRPPQSLSSREAYEVKAHLGELPEVFRWGHVRRAVDERWNAGLLCDRDKLFPLYFAFVVVGVEKPHQDRKSTRLNSSHVKISYAVFCLK